MRALGAAVRERAARTPDRRDRHVDFMRAVAICVVVVGHWMAVAVTYRSGRLDGVNALDIVTWAYPLTWALQVMPIFFFVGGFANAASLDAEYRRGGDGLGWMLSRTARLIRPVTPFFVVVPLVAIGAVALGVDRDVVGAAAWLASVPLWFLLVYLVMVAAAPLMYALDRRAGVAVPVVLVALVAVADVLRLGAGVPAVGESTYVLGWLAIHQLGFSWYRGRLPSGGWAVVWTAVSVGVTVVLTVVGPYDVRMVGGNTNPPSMALMSLAAAQIGIVLLLRQVVNRWLRRPGPWTVVVAVNAVILTMFVWHMAAAVVAASVMYPSGLLAQPDVGSAAWFAWRVPWLAGCTLVLVVLVLAFARIEAHSAGVVGPTGRMALRRGLGGAGLAAALGGLLAVALAGRDYDGPGALPPLAVLAFLAGAAMLRAARSV